mmetsp:Transcript_16912/g.39059  ORF Transcript_16912/g.39059 Transcript_16912/m.39059 type:complete len:107 (-) Transcript_16912:54-374(-)
MVYAFGTASAYNVARMACRNASQRMYVGGRRNIACIQNITNYTSNREQLKVTSDRKHRLSMSFLSWIPSFNSSVEMSSISIDKSLSESPEIVLRSSDNFLDEDDGG